MSQKFAEIQNGVVTNVIIADDTFAQKYGFIPCDDHVAPGWLYSDHVFSEVPINLNLIKDGRKSEVMTLRDIKIDSGIIFEGHEFQTRAEDRENVAGAAQLATLWLMNGGDPNSLRWADPDNDFVWIDLYNQLQPMTATSMINFGKALATMKRQCIFHALSLKEAIDAATTKEEIRAVDITAGWP